MKNILIKFISTSFFAVFLLFYSCNDDFLEKAPLDEVSNETFWNTEGDLKNFNQNLYRINTGCINLDHGNGPFASSSFSRWYLDCFTDNMGSNPQEGRQNAYNIIRSGRHYAQSGSRQYGYRGWNLVREINVGLSFYHKANISQEKINQFAGEAKFFRAWFYSDKVMKFGDVPWVGKPLNIDSEELFSARMPREQAMDSVLADINFAVEHMPEAWVDQREPGRFTKWHALFLKSRICLYEGTWRKYHGGSNANKWLEEAASAAKQLMDDGPYEIYNTGNPEKDYNSFHRITDLRGNPEVMYWREYEAGIRVNGIQIYYYGYGGGATKSFVDDYLCVDGKPVVTQEGVNPLYQGDGSIEDVFKNRDPRLRQTVLHPDDAEEYRYYTGNGELSYPRLSGMTGGLGSTTGYHIVKFFNRDDKDKGWGLQETPAIIMRYAEVLLNYAEAKAELGTITQSDLDISINRLRDRVDMPHLELGNIPDDPRYEDVSPLITEIRRERRIELFSEGFRYMDILRWKQGELLAKPDMGILWDDVAKERFPDAVDVKSSIIEDPITGEMKEYIDPAKGTDWADPVFDESKHYLWPIPLNDMSQNDNLKQNPGWQ